jgi:PBP1b-binding outer membrane lipoprotein LpoB
MIKQKQFQYLLAVNMKTIFSLIITAFILFGCAHPNPTESNASGNSAPEINSISMDPVFITVGTTAKITIDATDPEGDPITYSWTVALGDIIGSGAEVRYTAAFCCVGTNTIHLEVKDSKGAGVKKSIEIVVNP